MSCQRKFNLRAAKPPAKPDPNDEFAASPVPLTANSANLKNLACNSGVTVPVRLLAIEESMPCAEVCGYNSPHYNGKECIFSHDQFAHLYLGTEISNASIQHYIIAFVENTKIGEHQKLIDILCRTVNWLNIQNERPYFYIYYYGKEPAFGDSFDDARINLTRMLRSCLGNYEEDDKFCRTSGVMTGARNFTISGSNPYQFTMS
jgi:hypothetical protein